MCNNELWVGGRDQGVFLYKLHLDQIKQAEQIEHPQFKCVTSVLKTPTGVIVCDGDTGVHHLNHQGDYTNICSGRFSDASLVNDKKTYPLNYRQGKIHSFVRNQNSWVKDTQFKLIEYSDGCDDDKLCSTSTHLYVSSWNTHCVLVYTLSGECAYKTGERGSEVGKFDGPVLCDMDSEGKLLVCDCWNYRLQVFNTQNKVWSELSGLEGIEYPGFARVEDKHLWVGTSPCVGLNQFCKFEVKM